MGGRRERDSTDHIHVAAPDPGPPAPASTQADSIAPLRRSEERFAALAQATGQIVWTAGPYDGGQPGVPAWRPSAGPYVSPPADNWLEAVHPDDLGRVLAAWGEHAEVAQPLETECRLRVSGSEYRDMLVRAVPLRDETGGVSEWVGTCADITERRRMEREEAERASQRSAIFEAMADSVLVYDVGGRILQANPAARQLFGLDLDPNYATYALEERMRRMLIRDERGRSLPPDEWPQSRVVRGEVLTGELARDYVLRSLAGHDVQANASGAPIHDVSGAITGAVCIFRDVTERRRLEREVAERAATLEGIFEAMADAVFVFDRDDHITAMNGAARRILERYQKEGYTARPIQEWAILRDEQGEPIAPEQWPTVRMLRGETLVGADAAEVLARNFDGRDFWLSISGAPVRDLEGTIAGAVWVVRDVTDRRRLEQRTRHALDALLEMALMLVSLPRESHTEPDVARAVTDASTAQAELAGLHPNTDLARTARQLAELAVSVLGCGRIALATVDPESDVMVPVTIVGLPPEREAAWWSGWYPGCTLADRMGSDVARRLHAGDPVILDPRQPEHYDRLQPYGVGALLVVPLDVGELIVGAMAVEFGDVAHLYTPQETALAQAVARLAALVFERERLLRERAEAQGKVLALREANRRMDDFLSIASHELRTPVTVIKANIQILARRAAGSANQTDARLLERTERQVGRLARLVDDLVDVSRIHAGRLELREEPCDLAAVVAEAVEEQRLAHPDRRISLDVPDARPVPVYGDPDRLGQVVTNYLTNALKYSPEIEPISVRLRVDGSRAHVEVCDRGPGLSEEARRQVWDLFYRAPGVQVLSGSGVGLGLGLHISRVLVERHGGEVGVESATGRGACFWFAMPLRRHQAEDV